MFRKKKKLFSVLAVCCLSVFLSGCTGPIRGKVVDSTIDEASADAPIAGATVFLLKKSIDWEPGYIVDKIVNFDPTNDADVISFINEQLSDVSLDGQTTTDAQGEFLFEDKDGAAFYGVLAFKQGYKLDFAMTSIDFLGLGLTSRTVSLDPR